MAGVDLFGHAVHELGGIKDQIRIEDLLEEHGVSEEEHGRTLQDEGYNFALARLETHRSKVIRLAKLLVEHGRVEASEVMLLMQSVG